MPILILKNFAGEALVLPPVAIAFRARRDGFKWTNHTDGDVLLILPEGVFDGPFLSDPLPPGQTLALAVSATAPLGAHRYQVFSFATRALARGNSDPEMIILP